MTRGRWRGLGQAGGAWRAVLRGPQPLADAGWLCWILCWRVTLRGAKHLVSLPALVRIVRRSAGGPIAHERSAFRRQLVGEWFAQQSSLLPGNCLERSLLVHATWARGIDSTRLVIGFRRDGRDTQGHTWVTSDGGLLLESADAVAGFEPACAFDSRGARVAAPDGA